MAAVYFDASALVKLLVAEPDREIAVALWDGADAVATSIVSRAEVRSALAAAQRARRLTRGALDEASALWQAAVSTARTVPADLEIVESAGHLAQRHALGALDAIHLASALLLEGRFLMATWDRRLGAAARSAGLTVVGAA